MDIRPRSGPPARGFGIRLKTSHCKIHLCSETSHRTRLRLDMNDTHQVLTYADDVNLIGDDIRTIERNSDMLLNACKDIGLAVNTKLSTWK